MLAIVMILDLDVGNTRVKWRLLENGCSVASGSQDTATVIAGEFLELPEAVAVGEARIACVAGSEALTALQGQLFERFSVALKVARVSQDAGTIACAYDNPQALGVDRWLAMLAAYSQFNEALLVIDAGSAITMDLLGPEGQHLGGYIAPGLRLMHDALWRDTNDIGLVANNFQELLLPGENTQQAVNRGCLLMAVATIEKLASEYPVRIVVTGGDAKCLEQALSIRVEHCPDLVLEGLLADEVRFETL
jgi:type III pantothenate kinase